MVRQFWLQDPQSIVFPVASNNKSEDLEAYTNENDMIPA